MKRLTREARKALQEIGRAGGKAKADKMTEQQRKALGKQLAAARAAARERKKGKIK